MESLYCPFVPKVHPDASSIHESSVSWAQSLGMLPTDQHVRTALRTKLGWLVARAFPTAMPRGLQLVADWAVLCRALDEHTEGLGGSDEVAAYLLHVLDLLRVDIAGAFDDPFVAGMRDLRQRLLVLAPSHFTHFADRLEELFSGYVIAARNREREQVPNFASYLPLREITTGLHVMFSLAEAVDGFCLPDPFREHPGLQELATRACNIVGWANDLFLCEKEILRGEVHNLVLVLMNERRLTVAEAIAEAVALHDDEVRRFLEEIEHLPRFGVSGTDVQRYVEMLRCWIRGNLDWAHDTGRYRPFDEPAGESRKQSADTPATA